MIAEGKRPGERPAPVLPEIEPETPRLAASVHVFVSLYSWGEGDIESGWYVGRC
jgi:hypothetical protein